MPDETPRQQREMVLRATAARTDEPVLAEMAKEVLAGKVTLHDALLIPAYADAFVQRVRRIEQDIIESKTPNENENRPQPPPDDESFEYIQYLR